MLSFSTQAEGENEVNNELANRMSLFYAEATPMLKTLSDATTKFVSEVSIAREAIVCVVTCCLSADTMITVNCVVLKAISKLIDSQMCPLSAGPFPEAHRCTCTCLFAASHWRGGPHLNGAVVLSPALPFP